MTLELYQAELNRPLYIVAVQSYELRQWLAFAGIESGDVIWKTTLEERILSVWVKGGWGQVIISPGMAADIMVKNQAGTIQPLHQISIGTAGRIVGYKHYGAIRFFWDVKKISIGSKLHVHKRIDRLVFHIRIGENTLFVDDETAFHTWMKAGGQWVQLGALPIGRSFHPQLFTGRRDREHMFARMKRHGAPPLTLSQIVPRSEDQYGARDVHIRTQSGDVLSLTKKESKDIKVRFCDVCWSCGICR